MDHFRLLHMFSLDAMHKKSVTETMSAKDINALYVMKNETHMTASILPINDNAHTQEPPRKALLTSFRGNEREIIDNVQPIVEMPLSPTKIKTHIFSSAINQLVQFTPMQKFTMAAEIKSKPQPKQEAVVIPMEPDYTGTNIVPLFPPRALTIAS